MKRPATMSRKAHEGSPRLALSVQYATDAPELPRWRLRRWVQHAVKAAAQAGSLPGVSTVALALRLVDSDEAQTLNRDFRGRDYATNVLTFEYGIDEEATASGDIILCIPVLHREAAEQGKAVVHHAAHLTVHGVLHALGYDHLEPQEAETMEALETAVLAVMGIADPYQA
jgi:probable rRNA maturation factor